jgi:CotH kinase protein/Lamin Tail Domain/FlgD Ig-like domain
LILILLFAGILLTGQVNTDLQANVSYSPRYTAHISVDPLIPEGAIVCKVTTSEPAIVNNPPVGLTQIDPLSWRYIFPWDWSTPLTLEFEDDYWETISVPIWPPPDPRFDPARHDIPVLHIRTDGSNLWAPDSGLYVYGENNNCLNRGESWEKPAIFEWYDKNEAPELVEAIGLRVQGSYSRNYRQKGLRFYFDEYGSQNDIEYDFFQSEPADFQRLMIRSAISPSIAINSLLGEEMNLELGNLGSRHRNIALYLNNEYWGLQVLRERIDSEFIECTHDLASDDFFLVADGTTRYGDSSAWWEFAEQFKEDQPYSSHSWYNQVVNQFNIAAYIDWLLINIYGATADNGSMWNLSIVKVGTDPIQFVMWDEDGLFYRTNRKANYFRFFSATTLEEFEQFRPPALWSVSPESRLVLSRIFHGLMQNCEFRTCFAKRYHELSDSIFRQSHFSKLIDRIATEQLSEMTRHVDRWSWNSDSYPNHIAYLKTWPDIRLPYMNAQFIEFMDHYRTPMELSHFSVRSTHDGQLLEWSTESETGCTGFILSQGTSSDGMSPIAELDGAGTTANRTHYRFIDSGSDASETLYYRLSWVDSAQQEHEIDWTVESTPPCDTPICINELLAKNNTGIQDEYGDNDDWLELYNDGHDSIDLMGFYLSDNEYNPTKWALPAVQLASKSHLVIWCDGEEEEGLLHASFKLDSAGELVTLYHASSDRNILVDRVIYPSLMADVSYGRAQDAGTNLIELTHATPGRGNGSGYNPPLDTAFLMFNQTSPNPSSTYTTFEYEIRDNQSVQFAIYDATGRLVTSLIDNYITAGIHDVYWDGNAANGNPVASGIYFASLRTSQRLITHRLLLVR